jgi:hypothetical protein
VGAVALSSGIVLVFGLGLRSGGITNKEFQRLQLGMTMAEVEAVLGPPGDFATGPTHPVFGEYLRISASTPDERPVFEARREWDGDQGAIYVDFDASDKVRRASFSPMRKDDIGLFDNLLWQAKRQWRRWFP